MTDLEKIYEDEDMLVVNKPSGLTVNRSDTTRNEKTLQELIEKEVEFSETNEEFLERSGIVHRLDKETSGLILIAKNAISFHNLQKQFKNREVEKEYIALVHGELKPGKGLIKVPIGRLPWNRKRFGVLPGGREAESSYEVLGNFQVGKEKVSLIRVYPKTGRTHQIRVHMRHIGHPVFADSIYGGRKTIRSDRRLLDRLFLHASKIVVKHPKTGNKMVFESTLPKNLQAVIE